MIKFLPMTWREKPTGATDGPYVQCPLHRGGTVRAADCRDCAGAWWRGYRPEAFSTNTSWLLFVFESGEKRRFVACAHDEQETTCPECKGVGEVPATRMTDCPKCGGAGTVKP